MSLEQDLRTGDLYIDPSGKTNYLEEIEALRQSIRNTLMTWQGTDPGAVLFGPDWKKVFTLAGSEDATVYITMELSRVLSPSSDPRIVRISSINIDTTKSGGRRGYKIDVRVLTIYAKELRVTELMFP